MKDVNVNYKINGEIGLGGGGDLCGGRKGAKERSSRVFTRQI